MVWNQQSLSYSFISCRMQTHWMHTMDTHQKLNCLTSALIQCLCQSDLWLFWYDHVQVSTWKSVVNQWFGINNQIYLTRVFCVKCRCIKRIHTTNFYCLTSSPIQFSFQSDLWLLWYDHLQVISDHRSGTSNTRKIPARSFSTLWWSKSNRFWCHQPERNRIYGIMTEFWKNMKPSMTDKGNME